MNYKVDWNKVILDLTDLGMSAKSIARSLGIPVNTIYNWKNWDVEPSFSSGYLLISLWFKKTAKTEKDIPWLGGGL